MFSNLLKNTQSYKTCIFYSELCWIKVEINFSRKGKLNRNVIPYLPLTVVYLITSPGRTTDSSMSLSITFSFCSMMLADSVSSNGQSVTVLVSDGGEGALAFLLK